MNSVALNVALALCLFQLSVSPPTKPINNQAYFSAKLFNTIAREKITQNVVMSPASIQTCLALFYIGADGTTADELIRGLHLGNNDITKEQVAQQFQNLLSKMRSNDEAVVKMANRIYVKEGYQIASEFNDVAQRYFNFSAENVNFSDKVQAAEQINNWIEEQTENKIQDLISPDSLDGDTAAILSTSKMDFHLGNTVKRDVDMMYQRNDFAYGEFSDLDAKALSMRYRGTNIPLMLCYGRVLQNRVYA